MTSVPQTVLVVEKPALAKGIKTAPWVLLFGRTGLFFVVQTLFALGFFLAGSTSAWEDGTAWWPIVVTITNVICLITLIYLFRAEGKKYWDIFRIRRVNIKSDLLALAATFLVIGPLGYFPNVLLGGWLFGDSEAVLELFAISDGGGQILGRLADRREHPDLGVPAALRPRLAVAGVDDEPVEPGVEARGVAQLWQIAPGAKQGLLRGVLGAMVVSKDAVGEAVATVDRGRGERREGVAIASARPFHEVDLHG